MIARGSPACRSGSRGRPPPPSARRRPSAPDLHRAAPLIVLNRRAATRPTITGVERWTAEVIDRLVALAPDRYRTAAPPPWARRRLAAQAWEQLMLPAAAAARRAPLVFSPANLAPLIWPRNVLVMHDAAVLREPAAYSAAYRRWHGAVGLAAARRARAVITVSQFSRAELVTLAGIAPERITVIPGGVAERFLAPPADDDPAPPARLGLSRPYVLTIATADARKNLDALIPVAAALAREGVEVAWAGDSRPYFSATGAPSGLRRLGYVSDEELARLYRGARAFVLPSRYEGFGLTCLEAMACGAPVIAADRAALPETCGDAALLADPDDPAAFTGAVLSVLGDDALAGRLRAAGLRRAARFTWDQTARRVDALLTGLASD